MPIDSHMLPAARCTLLHLRDAVAAQHGRRVDRADVQRRVTHLIDDVRDHATATGAAAPHVPAPRDLRARRS